MKPLVQESKECPRGKHVAFDLATTLSSDHRRNARRRPRPRGHGLQNIAGTRLEPPRDGRLHPRRDFLEERYEIFRKAS